MCPTIRIDDEVFERLKDMGEAFVDTPNSVLRRVLGLETGSAVVGKKSEVKKEKPERSSAEAEPSNQGSVTTYSHPRLCFKSKHIEPLNEEDLFQVETAKDGTFRFTKAEFYEVFPNVIRSVSYKEDGIYHYPTVPKKALPFKISSNLGDLK